MLSRIIRIAMLCFLGWIALVPQTAHGHYQYWIILFLGIFVTLSAIDKKGIRLGRQDIALAVFFFCFGCGLISAVDLQIAYSRYIRFIPPALLIYLLFKNEAKGKGAWLVARGLFLLSTIVAIIGLLESVFAKNILYERLVFNPYYRSYIGYRVMSTQLNPTVLASFLLLCLPLNLNFFFFGQTKPLRRLAFIAFLCNMTVLLLTFTRTALLVAFICLAVYFHWVNKRHLVKWLGIILLLILFSCLVTNSFYNPIHPMRRWSLDSVFFSRLHPYATERIAVGLKMLKDHPFFGVGLEHFRYLFDRYFGANYYAYIYKIPDNMYVTFLVETGIVGFTAFMVFIVSLLKRIRITIVNMPLGPQKGLFCAFAAGLIGLLIAMFTYDALYWVMPLTLFWVFVGVINGLAHDQ